MMNFRTLTTAQYNDFAFAYIKQFEAVRTGVYVGGSGISKFIPCLTILTIIVAKPLGAQGIDGCAQLISALPNAAYLTSDNSTPAGLPTTLPPALGWKRWSPNAELEDGVPNLFPREMEFSLPGQMFTSVGFDGYGWLDEDMDSDGIGDRVFVLDLLQGTRVYSIEYTVLGFCGRENSEQENVLIPCGYLGYGRGGLTRTVPPEDVKFPSETVRYMSQLGSMTFSSVNIEGKKFLAAVSHKSIDDTRTAYLADFWQLGSNHFELINTCEWEIN